MADDTAVPTAEPSTAHEGGPGGASGAERRPRLGRRVLFAAVVSVVLLGLFALPWGVLFGMGADWPAPVLACGTVLFAAGVVAFPVLMALGHGPRRSDAAARVADTVLGVVWVLFAWSALGGLVHLVLVLAGVDGPAVARTTAGAVAAVSAALLLWGYTEAMRVPRIRRTEVPIPGLGAGLDGARVVVLADTHYGPIDRARWSARTAAAVNALDPDILCHAGDIADGTVDRRRAQSAPLGDMTARLAKACVTGNHEYFGEAQAWLDRLAELGWEPLHNRHLTVERDGARLVLAGIDDLTAASSGERGHRADLTAALDGADPELPVVLLAHQPKQVSAAVEAGVALQISGHTHGGQIWPFHLLVKIDQPALQGLTRHGPHTRLYTSRGAGFWGPPFRIFAPSEISLLTLRSADAP